MHRVVLQQGDPVTWQNSIKYYENGFLTGPLRCMLVSLCTVWSVSLVCCTSCIWSGSQLRISCSHAKAWISLYFLVRRSPPCQLHQSLWSLRLIRMPRVSLSVLVGNIQQGGGVSLLKSENCLRLTDRGTQEQTKRERNTRSYPYSSQAWSAKNHDPILHTGWHGTDFSKTEHMYTVIGVCVSCFWSRPWNLICW